MPVTEQPSMMLPPVPAAESQRRDSFLRRFVDMSTEDRLVRDDVERLLLASCPWIRELGVGSCVLRVAYDPIQWPGSDERAAEAVRQALHAADIAECGPADFAWEPFEHADFCWQSSCTRFCVAAPAVTANDGASCGVNSKLATTSSSISASAASDHTFVAHAAFCSSARIVIPFHSVCDSSPADASDSDELACYRAEAQRLASAAAATWPSIRPQCVERSAVCGGADRFTAQLARAAFDERLDVACSAPISLEPLAQQIRAVHPDLMSGWPLWRVSQQDFLAFKVQLECNPSSFEFVMLLSRDPISGADSPAGKELRLEWLSFSGRSDPKKGSYVFRAEDPGTQNGDCGSLILARHRDTAIDLPIAFHYLRRGSRVFGMPVAAVLAFLNSSIDGATKQIVIRPVPSVELTPVVESCGQLPSSHP